MGGVLLANYAPILVLFAVAAGLAGVFGTLAYVLGPRRPNPIKNIPYESGMDPIQEPQIKFNVQFYRVALLFLVFDIEAAFFYPWAVLFRELSCNGTLSGGICKGSASAFGFVVMLLFLVILLLALLFVWRKRALEWD